MKTIKFVDKLEGLGMPVDELRTPIRVLVFQDDGMWVAQCLEYDIGAQASDIDTLRDRFYVVFKAELAESMKRHGKALAGIEPAPERFHVLWEHRARSLDMNPASWTPYNDKVNLELGLAA